MSKENNREVINRSAVMTTKFSFGPPQIEKKNYSSSNHSKNKNTSKNKTVAYNFIL